MQFHPIAFDTRNTHDLRYHLTTGIIILELTNLPGNINNYREQK